MNAETVERLPSPAARIELVIREAIESVVTPNVAAKLVTCALRAASLTALPVEHQTLDAFVDGPLFESLATLLGDDEASMVVGSIVGILPRVTYRNEDSHFRRTRRPAVSAEAEAEAEAEARSRRVTIVASAHPRRRATLLADLATNCIALRADDLVALFDQVKAAGCSHPVVVLDCLAPSVNPISVATLVPDLPDGSSVILWGANATLEAELVALGQGQGRFVRCEENVTSGDVASLARALMGR